MGVTAGWGTSSALNPEENFKEPQDISDIVSFEHEVGGKSGTTRRAPSTSGIDLGRRAPPTSGIDLSKDLDFGKPRSPQFDLEKPKAPRSGIGIEIGKSPQGNLGVGVGIPNPYLPGTEGRAGISIDPRTGGIRGGSLGYGIGEGPISASIDVGVDTPSGDQSTGTSNSFGCYRYVTLSLSFLSHTYGSNTCEPNGPEEKPKPPGGAGLPPGALSPAQIDGGMLTSPCGVVCVTLHNHFESDYENPFVTGTEGICFKPRPVINPQTNIPTGEIISGWDSEYINEIYYPEDVSYSLSDWDEFFQNNSIGTRWDYYTVSPSVRTQCFPKDPPPSSASPRPFSPPIPNPPPTKKKMDADCCKILALYAQEILKLMGRPLGPQGQLIPIPPKGFFGEEKERTETPLNPKNPNKKIKIKFANYYELAQYFLNQLIEEDVASDPRSFKRPTGYLQNPEYERDSEQSLKDNNQPDRDKAGNDRQLELDKKIYIQSVSQQLNYVFEAVRRLEYLFPAGELGDAKISKNLLIPGAKGDVKIHNMIQFQELFVQYINATLGDPRQILTIKDANPALAGDQPIEVSALTLADWARQIVKFQVDTGGDVDAAVNLMLRDFRTNMANRTDIVKIGEIAQALFEDTGMREQQDYIPLHLEGDPYAGQWVKGQGFKANPDLEKKTEEATEKVLRETMNPTNIKVKVSRRHKEEKTDMRDLLRGLADFVQRLLSVPSGGDAAKSIEKLIESAKFKIQTDAALLRQNISQAATASRNRTRKKKKP